MLLSIHCASIRAPSITSSARGSALRLPALVWDYYLVDTERDRWCCDLNAEAGRRRIQEKVSLLNECRQPQNAQGRSVSFSSIRDKLSLSIRCCHGNRITDRVMIKT